MTPKDKMVQRGGARVLKKKKNTFPLAPPAKIGKSEGVKSAEGVEIGDSKSLEFDGFLFLLNGRKYRFLCLLDAF